MANTANPRGFSAVQPMLRMREYVKGTATIFYPGDMVSLSPDGKLYLRATGGVSLVGVVQAYVSAAGTRTLVADDPDQQYYVQDDGVGGTLAQTNVGNNANIVMTTGTATYIKSKQTLDTSTAASTTAAPQLRILGYHPNDAIGKYVRVRVVINAAANALRRAAGM